VIVCICKDLDQDSLEKMRLEGIDTLKKVIKSCGAGGDCGTCAFKINRYLLDKAEEQETEETVIKKAD